MRFELTGPHSHTILRSVLRLAESQSGNGSAEVWEALKDLRTPASLPSGTILAITVDDPRLAFPPQSINKLMRAQNQISTFSPSEITQHQSKLNQALLGEWPSEAIQSDLWDRDHREYLRKHFYSDAELVKRKKAQPLFPEAEAEEMALDRLTKAEDVRSSPCTWCT